MRNYGKFTFIEQMIALREVDLFSDLAPSELQRIVTVVKPFHCEAGTSLVASGDEQSTLYILTKGVIELQHTVDNSFVSIELRSAPAYVGETSLFVENYVAPFTIIAKESIDLLAIEREDLYDILLNNPATAVKMVETFAQRVYQSDKLLKEVANRRISNE